MGGVQQAGRMTSMALAEIARERGWPIEFLSLNDSRGMHSFDSWMKFVCAVSRATRRDLRWRRWEWLLARAMAAW